MNARPWKTIRSLPVSTYSSTSVRQRLACPLRAVRALQVGVLDERHRRLGRAERHAPLLDPGEERLGPAGAAAVGAPSQPQRRPGLRRRWHSERRDVATPSHDGEAATRAAPKRRLQWDIVPLGLPTLSRPTWPRSTCAKAWLTNG